MRVLLVLILTTLCVLQEHLILVCELLRANLYEFQKYNRETGDGAWFTHARIQSIARQVSHSLNTSSSPRQRLATM